MVGMVFAMNQGSPDYIYQQLEEAGEWEGIRLVDLVYPSFLFCLGASVNLSLPYVQTRRKVFRIVFRTFGLFTMGILLGIFGSRFDTTGFEVTGPLQRSALCYFTAGRGFE